MSNISLSMSRGAKSTIISNRFIDEFMPNANGAYVKVYIYLLRLISDSSNISLSLLAERLDETEKDIRRALKYWEEQGVLSVKYDNIGQITGIVILNTEVGEEREKPADIIQLHAEPVLEKVSTRVQPVAELSAPAKAPVPSVATDNRPTYSSAQVKMMLNDAELGNLVKSLDQKLHRTVNPSDIQLILFFYECLGFGPELIDYLYDYCSARNKLANSYIEKVALAWAQDGVKTVEDATARSAIRSEAISTVMRTFGLNRNPAPAEQIYISRWFTDFGFSAELVTEACNRTILTISKPDFKYADRILESWNKKGIQSMTDLAEADSSHAKAKAKPAKARPAERPNSFNSFSQRSYTDAEMDEIEEMLLNKKQG